MRNSWVKCMKGTRPTPDDKFNLNASVLKLLNRICKSSSENDSSVRGKKTIYRRIILFNTHISKWKKFEIKADYTNPSSCRFRSTVQLDNMQSNGISCFFFFFFFLKFGDNLCKKILLTILYALMIYLQWIALGKGKQKHLHRVLKCLF